MSNRGRPHFPWNGTFTALGVEPVCTAFDLGFASIHENPLSKNGVKTAMEFHKNHVWTTEYSIKVDKRQ